MLPRIPYASGAGRVTIDAFGGLDRRAEARDGAVAAMENLCGDFGGVLASRPKRRAAAAQTAPRGVFAVGPRLFWIDGGRLWRDGAAYPDPLPAGAAPERRFAALGERLLIWPDRLLVRADLPPDAPGAVTPLGAAAAASCTFADGTYAGVPAAGNTILAPEGFDWGTWFRPGDGVTVSGAADAANNKTAVVREVAGRELRFSEHCFTPDAAARRVTVTRAAPELDFLCVSDNRVWGCRGDTIRCSKLGDPYNWDVFDGVSTDAWSVESGTPGAFTGCVSFLGYPVFFKEDRVFKVYGSRPSNFEVMAGAALGVAPGAAGTLAVAGETLYYLSRAGVVRYHGGFPSPVDGALCTRFTGGAAGSDGRKYWFSAQRADGAREMLVYDPEQGRWHREDALAVRAFAAAQGTLYAQTEDALLALAAGDAGDEPDFSSGAELADVTLEGFDAKYPVRLWLRYEAARPVAVELRCDGGEWISAGTLPAGDGPSRTAALPLRRCGRFRLRLTCPGAWKLYALRVDTRREGRSRK